MTPIGNRIATAIDSGIILAIGITPELVHSHKELVEYAAAIIYEIDTSLIVGN